MIFGVTTFTFHLKILFKKFSQQRAGYHLVSLVSPNGMDKHSVKRSSRYIIDWQLKSKLTNSTLSKSAATLSKTNILKVHLLWKRLWIHSYWVRVSYYLVVAGKKNNRHVPAGGALVRVCMWYMCRYVRETMGLLVFVSGQGLTATPHHTWPYVEGTQKNRFTQPRSALSRESGPRSIDVRDTRVIWIPVTLCLRPWLLWIICVIFFEV
jgi:hypothetical protein